jgi:hypothetical protein
MDLDKHIFLWQMSFSGGLAWIRVILHLVKYSSSFYAKCKHYRAMCGQPSNTHRRLGMSQNHPAHCGEEKNLLFMPGIKQQTC